MGLAIIYLYDSTVTDFTYNGQPLNKAYEVVVDNMINDSFFVAFNHPLDDKGRYKTIEKDKIVKVHTPDGMQPFRIMDRVKYMDHISIEAWPLFYADMRNKLVKPLAIRGLTGQAAINMFVNNLLIDTPFTFTSNIADMHDYHTQDTEERENNPNQLYNALDVFKAIVKRWQGELIINGYDVRVVNRLGKNTGALLYEKKNISDFTDEESIQDITTRLYGKSEWTERPEDSDEEVKHEISVKVESPLINAYSGIVFEKQYTNNDIRTEKEMKDWLNLKFTTDNIDKPSRNIKVGTNIVDDTVIDLGDSLVLKYVKHDVDMEIRMIGYTYDGYANRYIDIQLGDAKQTYVGNVQNTVKDIETNVNTSVKQTVNQILNANGERMIYSVNEPVGNFKNGDVWFDQQGGMYFWDEEKGMWVDHPYNKNVNYIADKMANEIEPEISKMTASIAEADNKAKDALEKVGVNTNLISEHKKTLDEINNIKLPNLTNEISKVLDSATSMTESVANDLVTVRNTANDAFEKANANGGKLTTVEQTVDDLKGEISQKVTSADVTESLNTFNETVKKQTASQITSSLTGYAKSTDLNGLATESYASNKAVEEAGKVERQLTSYAKTGDLTTLAQNIRTETAESLKSVYTKTETNGLLGDKISQATYESGIKGVTESVTSLEGNIKDLSSARNLLKDSWHNSEDSPSIVNTEYRIATWWLTKPLEVGKTYTFRLFGFSNREHFMLYTPNGLARMGDFMGNGTTNVIRTDTTYNALKNRRVWEISFTATQRTIDNMTEDRVSLYNYPSSSSSNGEVYWATLVEGTVGIDWQPAISDMVGQSEFSLFKRDYEATDKLVQETLTAIKSDTGSLSTRINDVKSTADGNKTTISNVQSTLVNKADKSELSKYATTTSLNQVKQTADGTEALIAKIQETPTSYLADYQKLINRANLVERTLGTTDSAVGDSISRIVQTSGIIQTEVASSVPNPNLLRGTDFKEGSGDVEWYGRTPTLSEVSYFPYGQVATIQTPETSGTANLGFKVRLPKKGLWYTLSFYGNANWIGGKEISYYSSNGPQTKNNTKVLIDGTPFTGYRFQITVKPSVDNDNFWVRPQNNAFGNYNNILFWGIKLEYGEIATPWENSDPATSSQITQLSNSWALTLKSGNDVKTAINATTDGIRLKGDLINLDANTTVAQAFWAKEVNAIKVNADNITTGTLDGSRIRANSIDTNRLTGNISEFIRTNWNALEASVRIDGNGLLSTASDNSQVYLQNGIVGIRNPSGASIGQMGYRYAGGSPQMVLHTTQGSHFSLTQRVAGNDVQTIYITAGGSEYHNSAVTTWIKSNTTNIEGELRVNNAKDIRLGGGNITNPYGIYFQNGGELYSLSNGQATRLNGVRELQIQVNGTRKMQLDTTRNYMYQPLNMQGNGILEQSDERIKTNIRDISQDSLAIVKGTRFADYEMVKDGRSTFGFTAQQLQTVAPHLIFEEDGRLTYDTIEWTHTIGHALQQYVAQTDTKIAQLEHKISSLQDELALLKGA